MKILSFLMLILLLLVSHLLASELETQENREGQVTVKVTPVALSAQAESWDFELTLNTHSVALDQDMRDVVVLVDDSGNEYMPIAWNGDPPGGHHRKVVLRFQPPSEPPRRIELHVREIGGVRQRVFRWQIDK